MSECLKWERTMVKEQCRAEVAVVYSDGGGERVHFSREPRSSSKAKFITSLIDRQIRSKKYYA